jgi:hypothetical protein
MWETLYWSKYLGWKIVGWSLKRLKFGREENKKWVLQQESVGELEQKIVAPSHRHGNEPSDSVKCEYCVH